MNHNTPDINDVSPHSFPILTASKNGSDFHGDSTITARLAAQKRNPLSAPSDRDRYADSISRRRNRIGNPTARVHVGVVPGMHNGNTVEQSRLRQVLESVPEWLQIRANKLWRDYNDVVLTEWSNFQDRTRQENRKIYEINEEIERHNKALETRVAELEEQRDEASQKLRRKSQELEDALAEAHIDASAAVSKAGGVYIAENPSEESVVNEPAKPLRVLAGAHLTMYPNDETTNKFKSWLYLSTVLVGVLFGTSFGIAIGIVEPQTAMDGVLSAAWMWIIFAVLGCGFAYKVWHWIWQSYYDAGERQALEMLNARFALGQSIFWSIVVALIFLLIEQNGLLKYSELIASTGSGESAVSSLGALALGMTSVFFLGATAWEGYAEGRNSGNLSQLKKMQDEEASKRRESRRSLPEVQEALEKIAKVRSLSGRCAEVQQNIRMTEAPFNEEISVLIGQKGELQEGLSLEAKRLIQDCYDNWVMVNSAWEAQLEKLIRDAEGRPLGFWARLWRAIRGQRIPNKKDKQMK